MFLLNTKITRKEKQTMIIIQIEYFDCWAKENNSWKTQPVFSECPTDLIKCARVAADYNKTHLVGVGVSIK